MSHIMMVMAPFYRDITEQLVAGASQVIEAAGHSWSRYEVAGAFELPVAISIALDSPKRFDGFIALGCVIRGETTHYDHLCAEVSHALQSLAVERKLALGFGLLTCENADQARVRAAVDGRNKGAEAARACLKTILLKQALGREH